MKKYNYKVFEDNGGGLYLFVFGDDNKVIYVHAGYEYSEGQLAEDITALKYGSDPKDWDGNEEDPQACWDSLDDESYRNGGWKIVADNDGIYPGVMGRAAQREFGIDAE